MVVLERGVGGEEEEEEAEEGEGVNAGSGAFTRSTANPPIKRALFNNAGTVSGSRITASIILQRNDIFTLK